MDIHNTAEDIVFNTVETIFAAIQKEGNPEKFCLCDQCRMDTCCYALNRIEPRYMNSNRGMNRMEMEQLKRQQTEADIATLVYKGLRLVNHNQRPTGHDSPTVVNDEMPKPAFDIPTIVGRLFDGITFAPLADVTVSLHCNSVLVAMRNHNWQNPYTLVANAPGAFTFWPAAISADALDIHKSFEFTLKIEAPAYETITHFFKIPVVSRLQMSSSLSGDRSFKLPDLYMFPPGEVPGQRGIDDSKQPDL
ncbi:MAG: late competence development ComFB family protein [Treponema sp.]|jgi:competence protein ComFB|nr:late competence development ComFB family protein [Treponema sp.]